MTSAVSDMNSNPLRFKQFGLSLINLVDHWEPLASSEAVLLIFSVHWVIITLTTRRARLLFSAFRFSSLHFKAVKCLLSRGRQEVAWPAASRRLDSPRPLCRRSPHKHKPTDFIFHFQQISLAYWCKRLLAPELRLGWKAPSRCASGCSVVNLQKGGRKRKKEKDCKVLLNCQYGREVTRWQTSWFKCVLKLCVREFIPAVWTLWRVVLTGCLNGHPRRGQSQFI